MTVIASVPGTGGGGAVLEHLRALVLLGGSVRGQTFAAAIGRSILNLPVEADRSVLSCWRESAVGLARFLGVRRLPMRVLIDRAAPEPAVLQADPQVEVSVERDPADYRGTAGVLRDISQCYEPGDYLLVADSAQVVVESMPGLVDQMASEGADVVLVTYGAGAPAGVMLIRCGALAAVPATGFVDLKEQALPKIAVEHRVGVVHRREPVGLPLRTMSDYVGALRTYHRRLHGPVPLSAPFAEDWQPSFSIVEESAAVGHGARVHDSVVLGGARVAENAVLVRTVVCPGAVVPRGKMWVEQLVEPASGRSGRWE